MHVPPLLSRTVVQPARALLDLAFPRVCLGCSKRLRHAGSAPPVCPSCRRRVPSADAQTLVRRFEKLPIHVPLAHVVALWTYDEHSTVAHLQHRLKYGNRPQLGEALGRWLAEALPACSFDLVVPVPLHRQRLLARGYNQSACLARGVASARGLCLDERLLGRSRSTRSQTNLDHQARWANVYGAFTTTPSLSVSGMHVLLVDDVMTTGATLAAAAEPLVAAGATVSAAALACTREYV